MVQHNTLRMTPVQMLAAIEVDPILSGLVWLALGIVFLGFLLKRFHQPYVIAYIIAGVCMGPYGLKVVTDEALISGLGSFGLVLLLFFIGMEMSLPQLIGNWKKSVLGTTLQIFFSIAAVLLVGHFLHWPMHRIVMLGFVLSLSSTAVVIKLLQDRNETHTPIGQNVIGILLAQDVLIVPMLITLNYLSGKPPETNEVILQIIGGIAILGVIAWVSKKKHIRLPFDRRIEEDHEMQVFIAFAACFGCSVLTAWFGLSSALGAFVAGILISSARATEWVHQSLHSFRVVFVALFFVSIGMLIDLSFIRDNWATVLLMVAMVFLVNNLINAVVLRIFRENWKNSLYAGAILAQIGEFSFILGATGFGMGMISEYTYQLIISVISISLVLSPLWIARVRNRLFQPHTQGDIV